MPVDGGSLSIKFRLATNERGRISEDLADLRSFFAAHLIPPVNNLSFVEKKKRRPLVRGARGRFPATGKHIFEQPRILLPNLCGSNFFF